MYNQNQLIKFVSLSVNDGYLSEQKSTEVIKQIKLTGEIPADYCLTSYNYVIHEQDSIVTGSDNIYHFEQDRDEFRFDEIDEIYIESSEAERVQDIRGRVFYTDRDNCDSYNSIHYFEGMGEYVTEDYMERNDIIVMNCGTLEYSHNCYYWESDGEYHYNREPEVGCINSYSYRPDPIFHNFGNEKKPVYFGIELEVENDLNDISNNKASKEIETIFGESLYMKTDGSLSDGFEIVSHPFSLNFIQSKKHTFERMLNYLSDNGFRSFNSRTCGMHIHISKENFTTWQLYRFMEFFQKNKEFIVKLSQRELVNLNKWAALGDESSDEIVYKVKNAKKDNGGHSRYTAINICNTNTIEIRIFRGTLAPGSFFKNIEFCAALFEFTRDNKNTDLNNFKQFIQNKAEFKNLAKFIKLKNL